MPRGDGKHSYADRAGTVVCEYGCGSWKDSNNSGGQEGVDPEGNCPRNPEANVLKLMEMEPGFHY